MTLRLPSKYPGETQPPPTAVPADMPEGTRRRSPSSSGFGPRHLRRAAGLILVLWTVAVAASWFWNAHLLNNAMVVAAVTDARSGFNKDVLFRKWATSHGGVYAPVTATTPPNPYLTNIVERDLVTPSGQRLTLINPAYMTRQVHEMETLESGTRGHITSLKPLRPENAPDPWEAAALRAFEQGRAEVFSREPLDGQPYLRFMRPLVTEEGCLKCHASQGYKVGEIRGGISIAVPLAPYLALEQSRMWHIAAAHVGLWALGALGIFVGGRQMRRRLDAQLRAEEALRRSEAKFRALYDSTGDAVMLLDANGFFDCNPATLALFGCATREEFCSKHPAEVSPPTQPDGADSRTRANEHLAAAQQKSGHRFEWLHQRADNGQTFPVEVLLSAMELNGRPVVQAVIRDITDRKQALETVRQARADLEKAQALAHVGSWIAHAADQGRVLDWSAEAHRIFGLPPEEFDGRSETFFQHIHPEDRAQVLAAAEAAWRCEQPYDLDHRIVRPDGTVRWVHEQADVDRDASGRAVRMVGVVQDITERKHAEDKLRQLSVAVEQSPCSIVITDPAGNIEYVNSKFCGVTGYTREEVLGRNPRILKSDDKSPEACRELWQTITAGKEWRGEFFNKKKNGELYWESASISPIRDPSARITHFLAVKEDITERKQTEAQREVLIKSLEEALASVKSLSGLLPICAGCKKIRDDNGYWSQVESYVQAHSEATFSHGMCPDCLKQYFPDESDDSTEKPAR